MALYAVPAVLQVVEDGQAAIEFIDAAERDLAAPRPALVLLDLNLPKRSGIEVLAYLRQSRACSAARVLIVTSSDSPADKLETEKLGTSGYFRKPPSYDDFVKIGEVVLKILDEQRD